MARLIDFIRLEGELTEDMPVIVADQVAVQIDMLQGHNYDMTPDATDFGVVAPPFRSFFVEAHTKLEVYGLLMEVWRGLHFVAQNIQEEDVCFPGRLRNETWWLYVIEPFIYRGRVCTLDEKPLSAAAVRQLVPELPAEEVMGLQRFNGRIYLQIDREGHLLDDLESVTEALYDNTPYTGDKMRRAATLLPFALKTISVLHQNTQVEHATPTRQQKRAFQRQHKNSLPLRDYYILKVRPQETVFSYEQVGQAQRGAHKREHVVRGHFRYYTPERPLFGRYSGAVWVADHQRGESAIGTIKKDYLIDLGEKGQRK